MINGIYRNQYEYVYSAAQVCSSDKITLLNDVQYLTKSMYLCKAQGLGVFLRGMP